MTFFCIDHLSQLRTKLSFLRVLKTWVLVYFDQKKGQMSRFYCGFLNKKFWKCFHDRIKQVFIDPAKTQLKLFLYDKMLKETLKKTRCYKGHFLQFKKTGQEPGDKLQMGYKSIMRTDEWVSQSVSRPMVDVSASISFEVWKKKLGTRG